MDTNINVSRYANLFKCEIKSFKIQVCTFYITYQFVKSKVSTQLRFVIMYLLLCLAFPVISQCFIAINDSLWHREVSTVERCGMSDSLFVIIMWTCRCSVSSASNSFPPEFLQKAISTKIGQTLSLYIHSKPWRGWGSCAVPLYEQKIVPLPWCPKTS